MASDPPAKVPIPEPPSAFRPSAVTVPAPLTLTHRLFSSKVDSRIAHFNRLLTTSSGVDTTLLVIGYTLNLLQSQLRHLLDIHLRSTASHAAALNNAAKSPSPPSGISPISSLFFFSPAVMSRVAMLQASSKTLASACSDFRAFQRLWGLLGMWAWARSTYLNPPADRVLKGVAWSQVFVNTLYYVYEHPAYLASKNVVRGWSAERQAWWWAWSSRFFAAHVALDYVRLWRTWQLRRVARKGEEKEEKMEREDEESRWWKELAVNVAYSPLVIHWGWGGFLSDAWVGALGTFAGTLGIREAWRQTA